MKSTGECLGIAKTFNEALYKAFQGAGIKLPKYKNMVMTVKDEDKEEMFTSHRDSRHTATASLRRGIPRKPCNENGVKAIRTKKIEQASPNLMDLILGHEIDLVIDTPSQGAEHSRRIRHPPECDRDRCQRTDLSGYRNRTRNQSGKYRCEEADPDRYRNDRQEISMIEA